MFTLQYHGMGISRRYITYIAPDQRALYREWVDWELDVAQVRSMTCSSDTVLKDDGRLRKL